MKVYQTIIVALCAIFVIGCSSMSQAKGPTDVMKTLYEASKTKDVEAVKKSISKGTLALFEESAKAQNTTVDELLRKDEGAPFKELPEMRNEKIEGDTATIELKSMTTNNWETVPFVKEDRIWKLALDKFLNDMKKKMTESMKMPAPVEEDSESNASQSDGNKKPKEAANKPAKSKK
jgi:uncharacterized lipoprotein